MTAIVVKTANYSPLRHAPKWYKSAGRHTSTAGEIARLRRANRQALALLDGPRLRERNVQGRAVLALIEQE